MKWLKVKNMINKKISLNDKALDANGKDRSCKNCNHRPCPEALAKVCHDAFVKGYKRGYKQASDEQKSVLIRYYTLLLSLVVVMLSLSFSET